MSNEREDPETIAARDVSSWLNQENIQAQPLVAKRLLIELAAEITRLRPHAGWREALEKAAEQFRFYEREHRNKAAAQNADDSAYLAAHAKADTNKHFAEMCRAALDASRTEEKS